MAKKLTDLTVEAISLESADLLHLVDVSDTTSDPAGTSKKLTLGVLKDFIGSVGSIAWGDITGTLSDQTDLQDALALKYDASDYNSDWDSRLATKDTDDLTEGSNLYYTQARFDTAFGLKDTDGLTEGATNFYYTEGRFDTSLATKDTGDLTEGTNLYYTQARFDSAFALKDTDDLTDTATNRYTNDTDITRLANTSGTNTGDQDLTPYALKSNVLELDNTDVYSPTTQYHPATKLYVDTAINSTVRLQGDWNADTNTPDITSETTTGFAWRVSVAGSTDLGGIDDWAVGDLAVKTDSGWIKIANQDVSAVWGNIVGTVSDQTDLISYVTGLPISTFTNDAGYLTAETDTLQSVTNRGSITTNDIEALSFTKTGGVSTEFLKADGSVDTNTYLTADVSIADGGTGQSTAQTAINALTSVAGATNEYVLTKDTGTGNAIWKVASGGGGGSGDVVGPSSATNNALPRFDTTTGKLIQDSGVIVDDSDNMTGIGNISLSGTVDGIDIATDVTANTAKVTNATHTGQVTGDTALTVDVTAISDQTLVTGVSGDMILIEDATDGTLKRVDAVDFIGGGTVDVLSNVATARIIGRTTAGSGDSEELTKASVLTFLNVEDGADVTDTANVTSAGALMDSELTSITDVKALDQSVVSGATPTFTNTNFTEATDKNYVTDAQQTVIGNTSGTNTGDETLSSVNALAITTVGTVDTGTWNGDVVASAYLDSDTAHLSGSQTFTGTKTLNSFKGTGAVTVTNILDEDDLISDSNTALATQQSIKAYVDASGGGGGGASTLAEVSTGSDDTAKSLYTMTSAVDVEFEDSSNATVMYLEESTGNVGIGTTPAYKLDIAGKIAISGEQTIYNAEGEDGFTGSLFIGDGGGSLLHTTGAEGYYNTGVGIGALIANTTGEENTASGYSSLSSNTTGDNNTASGYYSLNSNTTGSYNTASGSFSLRFNTTGDNNTAFGMNSLSSNTTGSSNLAFGTFSLRVNTTGGNNTALGTSSLSSNTTGANNTASGRYSLGSNTTGSSNLALGTFSLYSNTTGSSNTALGYQSGRYITDGTTGNTTGDYNIFIGQDTKALADNDQNEIVIGYNATGAGSNSVVLGNDSIVTTLLKGDVGLGTDSPNQKLTIEGTTSLKEQASANADTASYGQIWVKDDAPNTLWFTDDAGTDVQLGTGIADVVDDTTPELGGELDAGAHSIGFTMQTATGDGTTTVDWKLGNHIDFTFGAFNEVFTFTAPTKPGVYTMSLKQDGTGSRTATFPATVKWAGGTAPTLTTTATTGYDIISFRFDGTNYYGIGSLNFS